MADQDQSAGGPIKLRFSDDFKGDSVDIAQGQYRRRFERKNMPFEVSADDARILLANNFFVVADGEEALPADVARLRQPAPTFDPSARVEEGEKTATTSPQQQTTTQGKKAADPRRADERQDGDHQQSDGQS